LDIFPKQTQDGTNFLLALLKIFLPFALLAAAAVVVLLLLCAASVRILGAARNPSNLTNVRVDLRNQGDQA
jgi:hypothetical protein